MTSERNILLSFDQEEFDMPLEYNLKIPFEDQIEVSKRGMNSLQTILNLQNISTTIFTTATYALENKEEIRALSKKHEIGSHAFYHSKFKEDDLVTSKLTLEQIIEKPVEGLRMPRMLQPSLRAVKEAGYLYDSSVNPTLIPGRYNLLDKPRKLFKEHDLFRLPTSVTPFVRFPLFWLTFKNVPFFFYKSMALATLKKDRVLTLYFHPWEFTNLATYKMPQFTKRVDGDALLERLNKLIKILKENGSFITMSNYIRVKGFQANI